MNTRKHPRTLNEAFGPYQDGPIHDPDDEPMSPADLIVLVFSIAVALVIAVLAVFGLLPDGVVG